MLELDPKTTALVLIDLQKGIKRHELKPYPADRVTKAGSRGSGLILPAACKKCSTGSR